MKYPLRILFLVLWCASALVLSDHWPLLLIADRAQKRPLKELATLKDLTLGIQNYHSEYARWPVIGNSEIETKTSGDLLQVLLGANLNKLNPREIVYIGPPVGGEGFSGLVGRPQHESLVDSWGHPYIVVIDAGNTGKITNPDLKNTDERIRAKAAPALELGVIAYSCGEDGIERTADDLTSWRGKGTSEYSLATAIDWKLLFLACLMVFYGGIAVMVTEFCRYCWRWSGGP